MCDCVFVTVQEFKEGRKASATAPQVLFAYKDPPQELKGTGACIGDTYGYVTFGLKLLFISAAD